MNFKIIGLRILEGCNPRFKKNLKENIFYNFLNEYSYKLDEDNEIESIEFKQTVPDNFYSFNTKNPNGQINISAIVGSNGSGKSNLLELFMASMLIISYKLKSDLLDLNKFAEENNVDIEKLNTDFEDLEKINIEIIYKSTSINKGSDLINKIKINNGEVSYCEFGLSFKKADETKKVYFKYFGFLEIEEQILKRDNELSLFVLRYLCYTNYINYSLHSLNSNTDGVWLDTIFHKNDGYQLPIVINPYRNKGLIDVNIENNLNINRFLINIIQNKGLRKVNNKNIKSVSFNIDVEKIEKSYKYLKNIDRETKRIIIDRLLENAYFYININKKRFSISDIFYDELAKICIDYIIYKLIKISQTIDYKLHSGFYSNDQLNIDSISFDSFIEKIIIDQSHHTLKLKQAINFLIFRQIDNSMLGNEIPIDTLNDKLLSKFKSINDNREIIDFYPLNFFLPSFFKFEINFEENYKFDKLSSGEKHKLYILHSIIYHIRNIISRRLSVNMSYENINLILDEVELYMHPEYQRTLVFDLIRHINLLNLEGTNINIMFATHSPFILSDIPSQNVLKLENGHSAPLDEKNSFASNIYDLLKDEFFLENGTIGQFASSKLELILNNKKVIEQDDIDTINLIGDPFLKGLIKKKIEDRLSDELLTKEIERLQKIKENRSSDAKN